MGVKMETDVDRLIEEFLELHVKMYIKDTLAGNKEIYSKLKPDENDMLEISENWEKYQKYNSLADQLIELGHNPFAMGARYILHLYETEELKKTIDTDTGEIKLELLRERTKSRKNGAEEYETIVICKNDSEEGSKTPSSLTGLFGGK
ncbi:MAG: hypothetical protein PWP73_227 [Methanococcus sp.]|jgi:hypothetical protein|nr:hypothetical protein [Methanococcus sp.]